jgi:hypothetical protein
MRLIDKLDVTAIKLIEIKGMSYITLIKQASNWLKIKNKEIKKEIKYSYGIDAPTI